MAPSTEGLFSLPCEPPQYDKEFSWESLDLPRQPTPFSREEEASSSGQSSTTVELNGDRSLSPSQGRARRRRAASGPLTPGHRAKIAASLRRRWKEKEYREKMSEVMKEVRKETPAWNAGAALSDEHREKLSEARAGRRLSNKTRRRMSKAHVGICHTPECRAKLSALRRGKPKSAEHKAKLAAAQRRRHAARRVLRAIEGSAASEAAAAGGLATATAVLASAVSVSKHLAGPSPIIHETAASLSGMSRASASSDAPPAPPAAPSAHDAAVAAATVLSLGPAPTPAGPSGPLGPSPSPLGPSDPPGIGALYNACQDRSRLGPPPSFPSPTPSYGRPRPSASQTLDRYKSVLREYRALQEELSPWTNAFSERNGRKPRLSDVLETKIDWLIQKYKQYAVLREQILSDTAALRNNLADPTAAPGSQAGGSIGAAAAYRGSTGPAATSGTAAVARGDAAHRLLAALEYKQRKAAAPAPSPSPSPSGLTILGGPQGSGAVVPAMPTARDMLLGGAAAAAELHAAPAARDISVPISASPRVKSAIQAAMEYRKKKAATPGSAPPSSPSPSPTPYSAASQAQPQL